MTKPPIDFYFDILSPFAYIASTQIDALAARHGRSIDWRPVLVGVTVMKVMGMKPLPEYPLKGPYLARDALRLAHIWGVPFKPHGLKGHNSLNALRAFAWLKQSDPESAKRFAQAMFRRLWVDGLDITQADACADEARAIGADGDALMNAIATPEVKGLLQGQVEYAIAQGVFGVPFVIADGEPFFGNDHFWMLEQWLRDGEWKSPAG
ncbi:MAG: 2-hydroxychromene-2-carboxylate isomerase [Beijerinckiaceae bacterium]|nr:2-hydroxychromene-2-carboxylate isomerase [Beijerinckiaceae bacterium]